MASEPAPSPTSEVPHDADAVEMPRPTVAPLVLAVGVSLLGMGFAFGVTFVVVGAVLLATGLGIWIGQLLPGQGHLHEPLAEPARRAGPVTPALGTVEQLRAGMPGYRLRLPVAVHPISAGVKGGIVGGLVMPVPAVLWSLLSGHGLWYPVNLLAGMALPGLQEMSDTDLEKFSPLLLLVGTVIHVVTSVIIGMVYGVLMPTLPALPKLLTWGGLLMPLLWTTVTFTLMGAVNPALHNAVDWPSFIACQLVFGVVAALVLMRATNVHPLVGGVGGGIVGGVVMPLPALLWGILSGHGLWYPVNLLAGVVIPGLGDLPTSELEPFNATYFAVALVIHAVLSASFGLANGVLLPRLPPIPAPFTWGGVLLPLVWTALSYGLMGIANPALADHVNWPWFIACQFVFGVTAAVIVVRSEMIQIPPAGSGPDRAADFVTGQRSDQP
jgi:hypothetical protein